MHVSRKKVGQGKGMGGSMKHRQDIWKCCYKCSGSIGVYVVLCSLLCLVQALVRLEGNEA